MINSHAKSLPAAGLAACLAAVATHANAQEQVSWDMQSAFGSGLPALGASGVRFSERVRSMSGGHFDLTFHEPGSLAPSLEIFDAVSTGTVDAGWTTPGYHAGLLGDAVTFFTSVPFGPSFGEFLAWKQHGGGQELREELYNAHGVTALDTFCIGPETSGWFKQEIIDPATQLLGLRMRFFGLGAEVMQKMGVETVLLAGGDILPALRNGDIDATEFSMPMTDINFRFFEEAKFNYFPGWHQRVSCSELVMNVGRYSALPAAYRSMLRAAAAEQTTVTFAETEAENPIAMREMEETHGVEYRRWRDETLGQFEAKWNEVVAEKSASDPTFKKIADSYFEFRRNYRIWGEAQAMKATYLAGDEPAAPSTTLFPLFIPNDDPRDLQGFARITNLSEAEGTVTITATDDAGQPGGEVTLSLVASQTRHFNSRDLEEGNTDKGLAGSTGDGSRNWRLEVSSSDLDIEARAFVRATDGFITRMQDLVAETEEGSMRYRVPIFNPGKNVNLQSILRLINPGAAAANVIIDGADDDGNPPMGGTVQLTLAPGTATMLTAQELEEGGDGFTGNFDAGIGKWQLFVSSDHPIHVMSLLYSRGTGNLTNLSR